MDSVQEVLEFRVRTLESSVNEIRLAVKSIDASLQTLARLAQMHEETRETLSRAFREVEDQEQRLRHLESEAPVTRLISKWIIGAVIGIVAIVGVAIIRLPDNHKLSAIINKIYG